MIEQRYALGLDLGKQSTYSAMCLLSPDPSYARRREVWELEIDVKEEERRHRPELAAAIDSEPEPSRPRPVFWVRHLERIPLNTAYREVARYVAAMLDSPQLAGRVELCVDAGGVGNSVIEQLEDAGVWGFERVVITGAQRESERGPYRRVPKLDLITALEVAFQNQEIKFSPTLPYADALQEELESFQSKITAAGNTVFEKVGPYDDLLLAASLALRVDATCCVDYLAYRDWKRRSGPVVLDRHSRSCI